METATVEFSSERERVVGKIYSSNGTSKPIILLFIPGWPADPTDFLGLGPALSDRGISVLELYPRGLGASEGKYTHLGALKDIQAALLWLRGEEAKSKFNVDENRIAIGGFSNGGGLAMAYAARDSSVYRVISCAGNDFGEFARRVQSDPEMADYIRDWLLSTQAPAGTARFDLEPVMQELIDHPDIFGLRENAGALAGREILMFGGWEDEGPNIEHFQLPLYRALKKAGAQKVTFIVYHTDHSFRNVYGQLAEDIAKWLHRVMITASPPAFA